MVYTFKNIWEIRTIYFSWPKHGWSPQCQCFANPPMSLSANFTMTSNSGLPPRCKRKKESFALPGCYAAFIDSQLPTFRDTLTDSIFMGPWKIGPIGCSETSVSFSSRSITCQLDRSCEKWRSVTSSQSAEEYPTWNKKTEG